MRHSIWLGAVAAMIAAGCSGSKSSSSRPIDWVPYLQLPIVEGAQPGYYPTGLSAAADGTLFVGSITGELVKFTPDSVDADVIVPAAQGPGLIANILVDDARRTVWVCGDTFTNPATFAGPSATVLAYDYDGTVKASYPFPGPQPGNSLCEDLALDPAGRLYVTDPFTGSVLLLKDPSSQLVVWKTDAALTPASPGAPSTTPPFGAHGITWWNGSLVVSNFHDSTLFRIPIGSDGSAGDLIAQDVAPSYTNPEAVHALDETHLLVTEDIWNQPGTMAVLTKTTAEGWSKTVLRNGLKGPTSVVLSHGSYWVTESQVSQLVDYLLYAGPVPDPDYPFVIDRLAAGELASASAASLAD